MRVTIAIPTHNRCALLTRTLASVSAQLLPPEITAECVVVDNCSTDATAATVAGFSCQASIPVRYVAESRAGSSYARNRAVAEADGEFIIFIDDDAVAEPGWAAELLNQIERRRLDAVCGLVLPRWSRPPPRWLGSSLYIRLAVHDPAIVARLPAGEREVIHNYFSANVCFRRQTFARFGNFREDLGVIGSNPFSGEDTELFNRIIAGGGRIGFAPAARVHHFIGAERMRRAYLRRRSYAFGYGSALAGGPHHNRPDKLIRNSMRLLFALGHGDPERAVYHQLECANFLGYWRGRLALSLARRLG